MLHIKMSLDYLWRRKHRFVSYVVNLYKNYYYLSKYSKISLKIFLKEYGDNEIYNIADFILY